MTDWRFAFDLLREHRGLALAFRLVLLLVLLA